MNPLMENSITGGNTLALVLVLIWSLFWKMASLWMAAKNDQKKWFLAILVLNTFGILEIIYIFHVAKKNWADVKEIYTSIFAKKQ